MNLAAKAGLPKVDKAYPSMALGTAEATPLQVATAYTTFANLGDRVAPMPIIRIAGGDGRTITASVPDRKNVVRPDVAYIIDDILKDVINRGTAAQAQSWGFRNVGGKTAFAGKTGTSRDGWFAGFTPELVCVVYVGFDNGDDLGMKGADSAMPVWADFVQQALRQHPEWNGDWTMPPNVRRGEIDTRNGSLIREIEATAETVPTPTPVPTPGKHKGAPDETVYEPETPPQPDIYVTNVPAEFRRIELFVSGTLPAKSMIPVNDLGTGDDGKQRPSPSPTPLSETWQESTEPPDTRSDPGANRVAGSDAGRRVTVMICPLTGMKAGPNCPEKVAKLYRAGTEPKQYCTFHR
jgi:penicillin-binding protein 1B